nr:S8 family serine peptidase [uncultured Rhodopila sp.]
MSLTSTDPQFLTYNYAGGPYGSNIPSAQKITTGFDLVGVIDSAFAPSYLLRWSFNQSWPGHSVITDADHIAHGTAVASIITGAPGILFGQAGIAPNASLDLYAMSQDPDATTLFKDAAYGINTLVANGAVAINNSWASTAYAGGGSQILLVSGYDSALSNAISQGRKGKGSIIIFAAGNSKNDIDPVGKTNSLVPFDQLSIEPYKSDPRIIEVAASTQGGLVAPFSTPGSSLLVAAIGVAVPAAIYDPGIKNYIWDYPNSGTSVAAPQVSAIVDLMCTVAPFLTWLDVQSILAMSCYAPTPSAGNFTYNKAVNWNGGGMHFSDDLGFGVVDANVAVNLAMAWTPGNNISSGTPFSNGGSFTVPSEAPGTTNGQYVSGISGDGCVTHVTVRIKDSGLLAAYSEVILISPNNTRSILSDRAGFDPMSGASGFDCTLGLDLEPA